MPKDCQRAMPFCAIADLPTHMQFLCSLPFLSRPAWNRPPPMYQGKKLAGFSQQNFQQAWACILTVHLSVSLWGKVKKLSPRDCFYSFREITWYPGKSFLAEKSLRIKNLIFPDWGTESSLLPFQTIEATGLLPPLMVP